MQQSFRPLFAAAIVLTAASQLHAGGLFITLGNPAASPDAAAHNAVVTLKIAGCGDPSKAAINARAIGMVDGHRQTIPLHLVAMPGPAAYALTQQWPDRGHWVLEFVAKEGSRITSTLVTAESKSVDRNAAKMAMHPPAEEDLAAMLAGNPAPDLARK